MPVSIRGELGQAVLFAVFDVSVFFKVKNNESEVFAKRRRQNPHYAKVVDVLPSFPHRFCSRCRILP